MSFSNFIFLNWLEREREGSVDPLFHLSMRPLVAPCVCPDWGSNPKPWHIEATLQPTEPPGQGQTQVSFHLGSSEASARGHTAGRRGTGELSVTSASHRASGTQGEGTRPCGQPSGEPPGTGHSRSRLLDAEPRDRCRARRWGLVSSVVDPPFGGTARSCGRRCCEVLCSSC